jgi:hypothetical protein
MVGPGGPLAPVSPASPWQGSRSSVAAQRGEGAARSDAAETSSAAEPVVFDHGREDRVEQSPASLACTRGPVEMALSRSRDQWRKTERSQQSARRRMRSDPPVRRNCPPISHASKPSLLELNRSSLTRRSRSRTKRNPPVRCSLPNLYLACRRAASGSWLNGERAGKLRKKSCVVA